jgi:hypothetical protein
MSLESFMNNMRKLVIDEFAKKEGPPPDIRRYFTAGMVLKSTTWGELEFVRIEHRAPMPMMFIFKNSKGDPFKFTRIQLDYQFEDVRFAMKEREDPILFRCHHQSTRKAP